jgi:flavorubredoxin
MRATLSNDIDWVGAVDWNIRDFHSYETPRGATYNAYLVRDEKTALVDTVKAPFAGELLRNVASLCELSRVDYVVCNHAEMDHSGGLPEVLRAMPQATLVCDKKCAAALAGHFDASAWKTRIVATGDEIPLGRRTLRFIETPMAHWPESMATYVPEEKLLFSMDMFGQHLATSERFDDQVDLPAVMDEAKTYYANIIMPYGRAVLESLERLSRLGEKGDSPHLPERPVPFFPRMIAPSHGLIWRTHAAEIMAAYRGWANHRARPKVLVLYDTMWESTAAMAQAILEGATRPEEMGTGSEPSSSASAKPASGEVPVPISSWRVSASLIHVRRTNLTRIAAEVLDAAAVAVGSPTLNRGMMPAVAAVLCYLDGLRPQGKAAVAFGSYGWGQGGPEAIDKALRGLDWEILREPLRARWRPTPEVLAECRRTGAMLAERAAEIAAGVS